MNFFGKVYKKLCLYFGMEEIRWVEVAKEDLRKARDNFKIGNYDLASFMCQQCVEKSLKALLIKRTGKFPKVHDLARLGELVKVDKEFLEGCRKLTSVYIETRYPGISEDEYTKKESSVDIKLAEDILVWVKERL